MGLAYPKENAEVNLPKNTMLIAQFVEFINSINIDKARMRRVIFLAERQH